MDNCKINNKDELERWGKKKESFIQALRQTNDLEEKNKLKQKIEMCKKAIKDLHETDIIDDNTYESHLEEFSLQKPFEDWGDAPTGEKIIGRETELLQLVELTHSQKNKSRLTIIHGFPGIGKTSLTVELVKKLKPDFDLSIWRSLREKPKIDEVLNRILENISNHNISVMPESLDDMLSLLMSYLKKKDV